jgi:hypothetical protein
MNKSIEVEDLVHSEHSLHTEGQKTVLDTS